MFYNMLTTKRSSKKHSITINFNAFLFPRLCLQSFNSFGRQFNQSFDRENRNCRLQKVVVVRNNGWSNERGFHVRKLIRWLLLETQIKVILTRWSHAQRGSTVWRDVRDAITSITFGFLEIATRVSGYEQQAPCVKWRKFFPLIQVSRTRSSPWLLRVLSSFFWS